MSWRLLLLKCSFGGLLWLVCRGRGFVCVWEDAGTFGVYVGGVGQKR